MVIGRLSNEHNSAILQAIEVKQTLLNFFFDSLSNDTKLYGVGWKNAKSAGLPTSKRFCRPDMDCRGCTVRIGNAQRVNVSDYSIKWWLILTVSFFKQITDYGLENILSFYNPHY